MNAVGQIALDHRYRFGYSFKNPRVVKRVTEVKSEPWFKMVWAPQGPSEVKEEIWKGGKLPEYPAVWRRASKRMHVEKLNVDASQLEMPSFNELGQVPGPTDKVSTTERGFWGSLENILSKTGDIILAREQAKIAKAQAETSAISARLQPITEAVTSPNVVPWIIGVGVLGVGLYIVFRRK